MRTYSPAEMPLLRQDLIRVLDGAGHYFAEKVLEGDPSLDRASASEQGQKLAEYQQSLLAEAELFHVAAEMTELAIVGGRSLPSFTLDQEDVPAELGFVVCNAPLGWHVYDNDMRMPVMGLTWTVVPQVGKILFHAWEDEQEFRDAVDRLEGGVPDVERPALLIPNLEFSVPFGRDLRDEFAWDEPIEAEIIDLVGAIKSLWLFMQQKVAVEEPVHYDRAMRRRAAREGRELPPVRVITLRRARREGASTGGSGREYHHQWLVGGHWRQQWYPKREVHRPVWIAPYVKGPAGAPILGSEKVYALRK
jgi:hypothetical protein